MSVEHVSVKVRFDPHNDVVVCEMPGGRPLALKLSEGSLSTRFDVNVILIMRSAQRLQGADYRRLLLRFQKTAGSISWMAFDDILPNSLSFLRELLH